MVGSSSSKYGCSKDAWTAFWKTSGQTRCVSGAADALHVLTDHWISFAESLARGARVLDLGCGGGAVARTLLDTRNDLQITGIDFARLPQITYPRITLLSGIAMESMPFLDGSFDAAVSQFGFEYGRRDKTSRELIRTLSPGGRFSFVAHHAGSAIVSANHARREALDSVLARDMREAFRAGNCAAVRAQVTRLRHRFPDDPLIGELAWHLPAHVDAGRSARRAIWASIEQALSPERSALEALQTCCVAPERLDDWLAPLRADCDVEPVSVLRERNGEIIAWRIEGIRRQ